MRTLLHLIALVAGAALLYQGLAHGLPAPPLASKDWGTVFAFGFGALLVLVGLRYVGMSLMGDEAPLGGGASVVLVALAIAMTVGAVKWRGRSSSAECDALVQHMHALVVARDPSAATAAGFEEARPKMLRRCATMTSEQRRCSLTASTIEALQGCP